MKRQPSSTTFGQVTATVALLLVCAAGVATGIVPGAEGAKRTFRTGLYVGKTSQGNPVKLKVLNCGKTQCLASPDENTYVYIELSCPSAGTTTEEILYLSGYSIAKNGSVNADQGGFATTTARFKVAPNGTLTGKVHSLKTIGEGVKCDSGPVTLKAKIGGTTK